MRDPFGWAFTLGRLFGITVRVHWLFPLVAAGIILRAAYGKDATPGAWIDVSVILGLLFVSVLLHEFGHCAGGNWVGGDAHEILLWPLGGLATVEVPHTPRANLIMTAAGPAVNLLLCLLAGLVFLFLTDFDFRPPWNPLWNPLRLGPSPERVADGAIQLVKFSGGEVEEPRLPVIVLARFFWVNWVLFLLNVLILGFPMDGARMLQCLLWTRQGYHDAMKAAIYSGFLFMAVLALISIFTNEVLVLFLALFIALAGWRQWILLITGGEDSMFGYDFSQGYTSLERDQPPPVRRRRPNFFKRWLQQRAARKLQREQELRETEERRMDELLEKVQRDGLQALTDEERRFLKRVSDRYRHRQ